jgi:hypothetical protein
MRRTRGQCVRCVDADHAGYRSTATQPRGASALAGAPYRAAAQRTVQRIANILQRRRWDDEHFETLGDLLRSLMNREALRSLRRALRDQKYTDEEMDAIWREREKNTRAWWLSEHPGRTAAEYNRLLRDQDSEVWDWRRSKGAAEIAAEREAWERDHPGKQYPEHLCGLSGREYSDYERWRRKQERKSRRT